MRTFFLSYRMTAGAGQTNCFVAADALDRCHELVLAGAWDIAISRGGSEMTLDELKLMVGPFGPNGRRPA